MAGEGHLRHKPALHKEPKKQPGANHLVTSQGDHQPHSMSSNPSPAGELQRSVRDHVSAGERPAAVIVGSRPGRRQSGNADNQAAGAQARGAAAFRQPRPCGGHFGPVLFCLLASVPFVTAVVAFALFIIPQAIWAGGNSTPLATFHQPPQRGGLLGPVVFCFLASLAFVLVAFVLYVYHRPNPHGNAINEPVTG